jgi:hypothetical protein
MQMPTLEAIFMQYEKLLLIRYFKSDQGYVMSKYLAGFDSPAPDDDCMIYLIESYIKISAKKASLLYKFPPSTAYFPAFKLTDITFADAAIRSS